MAVDNQMSVDGIGKGREADELVLLIADHLDWTNEKEHLTLLQSKINAYAMFIESKQYQNVYHDEEFNRFLIQIMFLHAPIDKVQQFLEKAGSYLQQFNIRIITDTVG